VLLNTYGDSDVISMPAGFRRHLVGKTLRNVFHWDLAKIRFVGLRFVLMIFGAILICSLCTYVCIVITRTFS